MKKIVLSMTLISGVLGFGKLAFADSYVCPTLKEAINIVSTQSTTWNGWNVSNYQPVNYFAPNGNFESAIVPGVNAQLDPGQTVVSVGCLYTSSEPKYLAHANVNLDHNNLDTYVGVKPLNWTTDIYGWMTCSSTNVDDCAFEIAN